MGWRELLGWHEAMRRQIDGAESDPGSWKGTADDAWWANARRARAEERGR